MEVSALSFITSDLITRTINQTHQLSVTITNLISPYNIIDLSTSDRVNFNLFISFSQTEPQTINEFLQFSFEALEFDDMKAGLDSSQALDISFDIITRFNYSECGLVNYLCILVNSTETASFVDGDLLNNLKCLDLVPYKVCSPSKKHHLCFFNYNLFFYLYSFNHNYFKLKPLI